ncbi:MAG: thermonuclease family protein [Acidimicrobiia bacterium]
MVAVVDGDSLRVDLAGSVIDVRLAGINAPESDECHADVASRSLDALVADEAILEVVGTDQYGRTVGYVWSAANLVNAALVERGDALAMSDGEELAAALIDAEDSARLRRVGMWNPASCGERVVADVEIEMTEPDPPGPDHEVLHDEIVTIVNRGASDLDLTDFVLRDESSVNRLRFPPGTVIRPGDRLEITSGCDPQEGIGWCSTTPIWNNGGDSALLLAPGGTVLTHVRYAP